MEFEAANTVLKMGVYTSLAIDKSSSTTTLSDNFVNNFIIFGIVFLLELQSNTLLEDLRKEITAENVLKSIKKLG